MIRRVPTPRRLWAVWFRDGNLERPSHPARRPRLLMQVLQVEVLMENARRPISSLDWERRGALLDHVEQGRVPDTQHARGTADGQRRR
jgi:hypothetical protein